ncbi:uncharacterized protein LOC120255895 [Dioscorea cayenensis subsp. rotundata]|uniref:Uncharacterized protein LOC120255895 n=1 Tax=Dioscorea cayennensis subsp. rotundata TaxID=55577 RepID=A0AB40AYI4_DIOCR|nr:uncharacterized protein LOC120255895 [Dioscorea cayenensis subsp. rotundata]
MDLGSPSQTKEDQNMNPGSPATATPTTTTPQSKDDECLTRKEFLDIDNAIRNQDLRFLQKYVKGASEHDVRRVNLSEDPLLNVMIAYDSIKDDILFSLINMMTSEALEAKNEVGDTALHVAAAKNRQKVANYLLEKNSRLKYQRNKKGETPLLKAALFGSTETFDSLLDRDRNMIFSRNNHGASVLHCAIVGNNPDLALKIAQLEESLMTNRNDMALTPLQLMVTMPEVFQSSPKGPMESLIYAIIPLNSHNESNESGKERDEETPYKPKDSKQFKPWVEANEDNAESAKLLKESAAMSSRKFLNNCQCFAVKVFTRIKELEDQKNKHAQTMKLIAYLARDQSFWDFIQYGMFKKNKPRGMTTTANMTAIVKIIAEMIKGPNPELPSWLLSDVKGDKSEELSSCTWLSAIHQNDEKKEDDEKKNTILHYAAGTTIKREGLTLQMLQEIKWFEMVKKLLPKDMVYSRNIKEKTAQELFDENHSEMVKSGRDQLMEIGKTCSGLLAAVVFATSFNIPGGKDSDNSAKNNMTNTEGNHFSNESVGFKVFTHAYMIGLSLATCSLILFLSFLTSNYSSEAFRKSLPTRCILAGVSFFCALMALLVAFVCNAYLTIYGGRKPKAEDLLPLILELTGFPLLWAVVWFFGGFGSGFLDFILKEVPPMISAVMHTRTHSIDVHLPVPLFGVKFVMKAAWIWLLIFILFL